MLTHGEVGLTVDTIAAAQLGDGMVPWFTGSHGDPWNHVEAAMALTVGRQWVAAELAYVWLACNQNPDGSWFNRYQDGAAVDRRLDTNVCAYPAVGVWHHYLATDDLGFLEAMFPMVEAAMAFVLRLQRPGGEVLWGVDPDGTTTDTALLTASSSIYFSLRCAIAGANRLGRPKPHWKMAAGRLCDAIANRSGLFAPKHRFAMDWYYPVLCGAVHGASARDRLQGRWPNFVMDGLGVRCVADQPWVTAAETAECAMAFAAVGLHDEARLLLEWAHHLRHIDGSYWTGCVHPRRAHFPGGERSTYGAAAVVIAHHLLSGFTEADLLFSGRGLLPQSPVETRRSTLRLPVALTSSKAPEATARHHSS